MHGVRRVNVRAMDATGRGETKGGEAGEVGQGTRVKGARCDERTGQRTQLIFL